MRRPGEIQDRRTARLRPDHSIGAVLGLFLLSETLTLFQWTGIVGIAAAVLGTALTAQTT